MGVYRSGGKRPPSSEARTVRPGLVSGATGDGVNCNVLQGEETGMLGVIPFVVSEWVSFRNLERLHLLRKFLVALNGKLVGWWGRDVAFTHV